MLHTVTAAWPVLTGSLGNSPGRGGQLHHSTEGGSCPFCQLRGASSPPVSFLPMCAHAALRRPRLCPFSFALKGEADREEFQRCLSQEGCCPSHRKSGSLHGLYPPDGDDASWRATRAGPEASSGPDSHL